MKRETPRGEKGTTMAMMERSNWGSVRHRDAIVKAEWRAK
jgi:hypothetical protein